MTRVRNRHTSTELKVRSSLHRLGFRFSLHRSDLPGSPDIVLPRHRKVILVHGCFWHGHDCPKGKRPTTRVDFWNRKLDGNIARDQRSAKELKALGWDVLTLWECQTVEEEVLQKALLRFLKPDS